MKSFVTIFALCLISLSATSQHNYTWSEYGISFSLADDFVENVNTAEEFSASGDGMEFVIIPFKNDAIDDSDITAYTMSIAASLELTRFDDVSIIDINGMKGAYAEGVQDDVKIFIMGLIDPNSDTNFFVIITFLDNDQNAIDEAISICRSIRRI